MTGDAGAAGRFRRLTLLFLLQASLALSMLPAASLAPALTGGIVAGLVIFGARRARQASRSER